MVGCSGIGKVLIKQSKNKGTGKQGNGNDDDGYHHLGTGKVNHHATRGSNTEKRPYAGNGERG
jgi:hypothetical protein